MVIQDRLDVDKEVKMYKLTKEEMTYIYGSGFTGTLINAVRNGILSITDIGRYFGSSIRRIIEGNLCRY